MNLSYDWLSMSGADSAPNFFCPQGEFSVKLITEEQQVKHVIIATAVLSGLSYFTPASANDLAAIYEQALQSDPQLKAATFISQADAEAEVQGKATLLPTINFNAETGYSNTSPSSSSSDGNSNSWSVELNQPVFRADNWFTYQSGKITSERAKVTLSQAQQDLIRRTVAAYFTVLQSKAIYDTTVAEEAAVKRRLEQVEAQFEVGLIASTDVEEAKASYDLARVSRIEAAGDLDKSYESLDRLTGEVWDDVQPLDENYPIEALVPASYQPWIDKALENNLSLQAARYDADSAMQNRKSSQSGHYPTLDFVASYGNSDNASVNDRDTGYIGLSLSVPIFAGGSTSSKVRESYNRWDAALQTQEDTRRQVVLETRSLFRDLSTDVETVAARQQSIASAEKALEAVEAGYEAGTRNIVDVLDAEKNLYGAIRDYQVSRYDHILNKVDFKQSMGTLSPDDLYALDQWLAN